MQQQQQQQPVAAVGTNGSIRPWSHTAVGVETRNQNYEEQAECSCRPTRLVG